MRLLTDDTAADNTVAGDTTVDDAGVTTTHATAADDTTVDDAGVTADSTRSITTTTPSSRANVDNFLIMKGLSLSQRRDTTTERARARDTSSHYDPGHAIRRQNEPGQPTQAVTTITTRRHPPPCSEKKGCRLPRAHQKRHLRHR